MVTYLEIRVTHINLIGSSDITRNQHGIGTVPSTMGADIYIHHKVREGAGSSDDNVCTGGELYKHDVPKYNICNTCGTYCDSPSDLKKVRPLSFQFTVSPRKQRLTFMFF